MKNLRFFGQNVGNTDKYVRILLGIVLGVIALSGNLSWTASMATVLVAVVILLTAWANICPFYTLFGINTCPRKQKAE